MVRRNPYYENNYFKCLDFFDDNELSIYESILLKISKRIKKVVVEPRKAIIKKKKDEEIEILEDLDNLEKDKADIENRKREILLTTQKNKIPSLLKNLIDEEQELIHEENKLIKKQNENIISREVIRRELLTERLALLKSDYKKKDDRLLRLQFLGNGITSMRDSLDKLSDDLIDIDEKLKIKKKEIILIKNVDPELLKEISKSEIEYMAYDDSIYNIDEEAIKTNNIYLELLDNITIHDTKTYSYIENITRDIDNIIMSNVSEEKMLEDFTTNIIESQSINDLIELSLGKLDKLEKQTKKKVETFTEVTQKLFFTYALVENQIVKIIEDPLSTEEETFNHLWSLFEKKIPIPANQGNSLRGRMVALGFYNQQLGQPLKQFRNLGLSNKIMVLNEFADYHMSKQAKEEKQAKALDILNLPKEEKEEAIIQSLFEGITDESITKLEEKLDKLDTSSKLEEKLDTLDTSSKLDTRIKLREQLEDLQRQHTETFDFDEKDAIYDKMLELKTQIQDINDNVSGNGFYGGKKKKLTLAQIKAIVDEILKENKTKSKKKKGGNLSDAFAQINNQQEPRNVREYLAMYGDLKIDNIVLHRTPIDENINSLLNVITLGKFEQNKRDLNIDKMFHLYMTVELKGKEGYTRIEKNQTVTVTSISDPRSTDEYELPYHPNITLKTLFHNGLASLAEKVGSSNIYNYDGQNNNCQIFLMSLLDGNAIDNNESVQFILQNTDYIVGNINQVSKQIMKTGVDLAQFTNILIYGASLKNRKIL